MRILRNIQKRHQTRRKRYRKQVKTVNTAKLHNNNNLISMQIQCAHRFCKRFQCAHPRCIQGYRVLQYRQGCSVHAPLLWTRLQYSLLIFGADKVTVCSPLLWTRLQSAHLWCRQGYSLLTFVLDKVTECSSLVQTRLQFAHLCCGQGYSLLIFGVYKVTVCSPLVQTGLGEQQPHPPDFLWHQKQASPRCSHGSLHVLNKDDS